jgi:hypothetical protein
MLIYPFYHQLFRKFTRFELEYVITLKQAEKIRSDLLAYLKPDDEAFSKESPECFEPNTFPTVLAVNTLLINSDSMIGMNYKPDFSAHIESLNKRLPTNRELFFINFVSSKLNNKFSVLIENFTIR